MTITKPAIDPEKEEPPNGKDTAVLSTDLDALVIVRSETSKEVDLEHNAAAVSVEKRADSVSVDSTPAGEPATEEEIKTLFHVVDDIPLGVWLAAFVASMERFAWYGATGPMQNYLQHDRHSKIPGALGLEQATATLVMTSFMAFSYFTPLLGAVVADAWLGRFRTTFLSSM
ncbi:peptide transporter ptr2 [Xanthoria calcicola]